MGLAFHPSVCREMQRAVAGLVFRRPVGHTVRWVVKYMYVCWSGSRAAWIVKVSGPCEANTYPCLMIRRIHSTIKWKNFWDQKPGGPAFINREDMILPKQVLNGQEFGSLFYGSHSKSRPLSGNRAWSSNLSCPYLQIGTTGGSRNPLSKSARFFRCTFGVGLDVSTRLPSMQYFFRT